MHTLKAFVRAVLFPKANPHAEFWVSHAVVLVATVLGVYLAASAGFQAAVQFEVVRAERESYFLRQAMFEELQDNVAAVEVWSDEFLNGQAQSFAQREAEVSLDSYVWLAMRESAATFEIAPSLLSAVRRFYDQSEDDLAALVRVDRTSRPAAERLQASTQALRQNIFPLLQADLTALRQRLSEAGALPDSPP